MLSSKLVTIRQLAESPDNPFTAGQFRWWVFQEDFNGFKDVIVRIGRRVYIDVEALDRWIEGQRSA